MADQMSAPVYKMARAYIETLGQQNRFQLGLGSAPPQVGQTGMGQPLPVA